MIVNPDFNEPLSNGWNLEVHGDHVVATMELDDSTSIAGPNSARIDIESIVEGSEIWRLQFKQVNLVVQGGETYTWSFWAKAADDRPANVWVGMEVDPWATLGASEEIALTTDWQEYHFTFEASEDFENTRLAIQLAGSTVTPVWVDHQMLYQGDYVPEDLAAVKPTEKITSTWGSLKSHVR
jgi:hypothetical protein